ncbi:MAG TPA: hypothetical protein VM662_14650, partial [Sphingomonas sp.]|nr:hypothetical protein [Sphingomonas sp.]
QPLLPQPLELLQPLDVEDDVDEDVDDEVEDDVDEEVEEDVEDEVDDDTSPLDEEVLLTVPLDVEVEVDPPLEVDEISMLMPLLVPELLELPVLPKKPPAKKPPKKPPPLDPPMTAGVVLGMLDATGIGSGGSGIVAWGAMTTTWGCG